MIWADWLYLCLVCVITPVWGIWDYRRFLERYRQGQQDALVREYSVTIAFHGLIAAGAISVWLLAGRSFDTLGFSLSIMPETGFVAGLMIAMFAAPFVNLLMAWQRREGDEVRLKSYAPLIPFLPKTAREHRFGMAVSVTAGVAEEIAYRGALIFLLSLFLPLWIVLGVQAIIFGLAHIYQGLSGVFLTSLLGSSLV